MLASRAYSYQLESPVKLSVPSGALKRKSTKLGPALFRIVLRKLAAGSAAARPGAAADRAALSAGCECFDRAFSILLASFSCYVCELSDRQFVFADWAGPEMPLDTCRLPSRTFAHEVPPECGPIQVLHAPVNHSENMIICAKVNIRRRSGLPMANEYSSPTCSPLDVSLQRR